MVADTMVGRELLGVSMSTHLQVQCSTTDFPLIKPVPKNDTNGTNGTAAAPAEEAAEAEAEAEAASFYHHEAEAKEATKEKPAPASASPEELVPASPEAAPTPPGPSFQFGAYLLQAGAHVRAGNATNGTTVH